MHECNLENTIIDLQNKYYQQNTKSILFNKNTQKLDCATTITKNIELNKLFERTVHQIPNTNKVFFDYPIFKTFGNPQIYAEIIEYILVLLSKCIQTHKTFELHVNMKSFTITAAQRYKDAIHMFCNRCLQQSVDDKISTHLDNMYIYNSPKMVGTLSNLFTGYVDDNIRSKIIILPS